MRIATMERTPPEVIEGVEAVLRRRVSTILQSDYTMAGGVEHLAALLANVDRSTERLILDHLDKNAPELAAEVRKLTFTSDNLIQLDDPSLQRVLREVDAKDLAMAPRGVAERSELVADELVETHIGFADNQIKTGLNQVVTTFQAVLDGEPA